MGLGFVFTARDLASGTMRRVGANFNVMGRQSSRSMANIGKAGAVGAAGLGLMVAGVASLGGSFALANQAGKFEQGVAKVGAISRATAAELEMLSARAKQAGIDTQFSPTEATEGLANLAAQGFNAAQSAELLGPALDLAAGGQISIADASATTAAAVKVFSLSMDEASLAADQLLRISNVTALQAGDLQLALGTVSRGAVAAQQSIEEMLPAIGLVKNTGVDASVAASSVSSALQFMAKNAKGFKSLGVEVTDAQGNFRPFMDIVLDTQDAMSSMTNAADRSALALKLFGRFGITAFTGITAQVNMGIPDATGKIVKGAEAVEFLRDSMRNAKGAAGEFKDALLNTFEGQKTLLVGSLQTLGVEVGQTFTKAFKPLVAGAIRVANRLIKIIAGIPQPIKDVLGKVILIFGVVAASTGAGLMLAVVFKAIAASAAAIASAVGVALGVLSALAAVVGVIVLAFKGYSMATSEAERRTNFFVRAWKKIKLAFTAVAALISGRPVSKEIVDDLKRAENQGVFAFVQSVGRFIRRFKAMMGALKLGFKQVMQFAKPVFDQFIKAFEELGGELGFLGDGFNDAAATPMQKFIRVGFMIGKVVAKIVLFLVRATTLVIKWVTGFVSGVKSAFKIFAPVFAVLKRLVLDTVEQFKKLVAEVFPEVEKGADGAGGFMLLLGKAAGFIATILRFTVIPALTFFIAALNVAVRVWRFIVGLIKAAWVHVIKPVFEFISEFVNAKVVPAFETIKEKAFEYIDPIIELFKKLAEWIGGAVEKIDEFFGISDKVTETAEKLANIAGFTFEDAPAPMSIDSGSGDVAPQFAVPGGGGGAFVAVPYAQPTAAAVAPKLPPQAEVARRDAVERGLSEMDVIHAIRQGFNGASVKIDGQPVSDKLRASAADSDNREFRQVGVEG